MAKPLHGRSEDYTGHGDISPRLSELLDRARWIESTLCYLGGDQCLGNPVEQSSSSPACLARAWATTRARSAAALAPRSSLNLAWDLMDSSSSTRNGWRAPFVSGQDASPVSPAMASGGFSRRSQVDLTPVGDRALGDHQRMRSWLVGVLNVHEGGEQITPLEYWFRSRARGGRRFPAVRGLGVCRPTAVP
jgi:hypothetical protein